MARNQEKGGRQVIVHDHGKFHVRSENGRKNLGTYKTKEEAVKRLQQVHYFKTHPKKGGK